MDQVLDNIVITEKEINERDITDVGDGFGYRFNTSETDRLMIDLFSIKDQVQVNFLYKILPVKKDDKILVANKLFN